MKVANFIALAALALAVIALCVAHSDRTAQGYIGCVDGKFVIRNIYVDSTSFVGEITTDTTGVRCAESST